MCSKTLPASTFCQLQGDCAKPFLVIRAVALTVAHFNAQHRFYDTSHRREHCLKALAQVWPDSKPKIIILCSVGLISTSSSKHRKDSIIRVGNSSVSSSIGAKSTVSCDISVT